MLFVFWGLEGQQTSAADGFFSLQSGFKLCRSFHLSANPVCGYGVYFLFFFSPFVCFFSTTLGPSQIYEVICPFFN
jgi:hypothetical protein